jgi:hypothetical protein
MVLELQNTGQILFQRKYSLHRFSPSPEFIHNKKALDLALEA